MPFSQAELNYANQLGQAVGNTRLQVQATFERLTNHALLAGGAPIDSADPVYAPFFAAHDAALQAHDRAVQIETAWWRSKGFNV